MNLYRDNRKQESSILHEELNDFHYSQYNASLIEKRKIEDGSNINVSGKYLTIKNNKITNSESASIIVENSINVLIMNNDISQGSSYAILLRNCTNVVISSNNIRNTLEGIHVDETKNVIISNNTIKKSGNYIEGHFEAGISLEKTMNLTIQNNLISGNHYGILSISADFTRILSNTISQNYEGIRIFSSTEFIIETNTITDLGKIDPFDSYKYTGSGLRFENSTNIRVLQNKIDRSENGWGIGCDFSQTIIVANNSISRFIKGGIDFGSCSDFELRFNKLNEDSGQGINIFSWFKKGLNLNTSIIFHNEIRDISGDGIKIQKVNNITLQSNKIYKVTGNGIIIGHSSKFNSIVSNDIEKSKIAIYLRYNSSNNRIYDNTLKFSFSKAIAGDTKSIENSTIENNNIIHYFLIFNRFETFLFMFLMSFFVFILIYILKKFRT